MSRQFPTAFVVAVGLLVSHIMGDSGIRLAHLHFDWQLHLRVINDETASFEQRKQSEEALWSFDDPEVLRHVFQTLSEPVGRWSPSQPIPASIDHPDWEAWRQIPQARLRVFAHFAANAQPAERRHAVFAELFEDARTLLELTQFVLHSRANWTPGVRNHLILLSIDPEMQPGVRASAAWALLDMHDKTPREEYMEITERVSSAAWAARGSDFSLQIADRLADRDDPRVALLRVDLYEHQNRLARVRSLTLGKGAIDQMDWYFGNISGMYVPPSAPRSEDEEATINEHTRLQNQAWATGDPARLDEFEAAIAAQRQAVLDERLAVINAWIKENRQRLETEAILFELCRLAEREVEVVTEADRDSNGEPD